MGFRQFALEAKLIEIDSTYTLWCIVRTCFCCLFVCMSVFRRFARFAKEVEADVHIYIYAYVSVL